MSAPPRILITPGDPEGIGPEVTVKALRSLSWGSHLGKFQIVGVTSSLEAWGWTRDSGIDVVECPRDKSPGYQSGWAIEYAAQKVLLHEADALVTGPISKERLRKSGYKYNGHTDFLAALCFKQLKKKSSSKVPPSATMMLANSKLRVSLVTVHLPLSKVARAVTSKSFKKTILDTVSGLQSGFGVAVPHLAVLGLNPHAGENGVLGNEEKAIIIPAIQELRQKAKGAFQLSGPFPSDTFFAKDYSMYDGVIAMYHDQGLIPVKSIDFARTINITLGLPIIRTSVDHGVAFDIAGKGKADFSSMRVAIETACAWVQTQNSRKPSLSPRRNS